VVEAALPPNESARTESPSAPEPARGDAEPLPAAAAASAAESSSPVEPEPPAVASPAPPAAGEPIPTGWTPNEERRARPPVRPPVRQPAEATGRRPEPGRPVEPPRRDIEEILAQPDEAPAEPAIWLERLRRAFSGDPGVAQSSRPIPPPEPISLTNRELLKPLVGRDPADVTVRRGGIISKAVARVDADAVAVGNEILLGEGHQQSEPETTGLLAHELVHIARRRSARFVPPVISELSEPGARPLPFAPPLGAARRPAPPAAAAAAPRTRARPEREAPSAPLDGEEAVALATEARVAAIAREHRRGEPVARGDRTDAPAAQALAAGRPTQAAPDHSPWGSLPPPWEPIPEIEAPAQPSRELVATPASEASSTGTVHRAPTGRDAAAPAGGEAPSGAADGASAVDVDTLARQVYGILKRRLSDERRRAM
jgi:hypothetical protein